MYITSSRIKAGLTMLMYTKISNMTLCSLKSEELDKVNSLLVNNLAVLGLQLMNMNTVSCFPIAIVEATIILIAQIGWAGLEGIGFMLLMLPFSWVVSKKNGRTNEEINRFKDERVKLITELIEGIRYLKLYGWELAFKKMVNKIREN